MPTASLKIAISRFKKKYGRKPTQSELDILQKQAYQRAANERARKAKRSR